MRPKYMSRRYKDFTVLTTTVLTTTIKIGVSTAQENTSLQSQNNDAIKLIEGVRQY